MKKFTLFLIAILFSAMSFAALNPYAYGLSSTLEGTTLTVNYSLNAPATGVSVVILNGAEEVKTVTCNDKISKGSHSVEISTLDLPTGKSLAWKVVVTGNSVASPTLHDESIRFYLPYGMDIDVDPESDYLGHWYVIEASNDGKSKAGYQCNPFGRGLYAFDAALNPILNSAGTRGFLGGVNAGYTEKNINGDYVNFYRVATSGGRVFIGRYRDGASYHPIVEANPADLNEPFTSVFTTGRAVSIDAIGSGENLKLVMLAKDNNIYEYDLGNAKSIAAASRTINIGDLSILRDDATITYDNNGGIWFNQNRSDADEASPTIAHLTVSGVDYNNVKAGLTHNNTSNSGIAVSPDGKQLAVVGAGEKNITIYNINNAGGNITLTKAYTIATAGKYHTALAWDYAGNLFAANRTNERIRIFAMPYSGTVSTPCASKHAFVIPPQLNPFAYKLSSELSNDEKNLTIKYSLNANATSVNWVLMDGETPIKTVDLSSLGLEKGDYTNTISTTDFPQYKALTWKIEVKGAAVGEVTAVKGESFYRPFGVDIDNNPENPHFGRILCGDTYTSSDAKYTSCGVGSGIYEYNPAFELIPNGDKPGYNAGKAFTNSDHSPYRIRISEDGRIFVTAHDQAGEFLWEVNPDNLNEWTSVFQGATHNTSKLLDASGKFIAGTNAGFDVRGTGENLQLLMLSCDNLGTNTAEFQCHEYNIGTAKTWNKVPSKAISDIQLHSSMISRYSQVLYDKEGGFWEIYYINTSLLGGIAHFAKQADGSYVKDYVKNKIMLRAGGCAFNHDFSKLILCGDVDVITNSPGSAVIYSVSKDADGKPVLTKETTINTAVVGGNLNDFAWDYANNIYVVGNNGELLQVYALPHSSDDVVATPAASKYTFSIGKYTMIANTNDENKGTVTGAGEYKVGETATLTATAKEGYKLLYWSDRSTENPRTITMNKNEALSAYFVKEYDEEQTFTITKVWENTNVPEKNTNGYQAVGWDEKVYLQASADSKIKVYSNSEDAPTEYATSSGGYQIAVDEVGNLIVFNAYFATATPGNVLIYKKGSTTGKTVTFTLPNPGRCDFFSASGDIYSAEGGYVYFYCNDQTVVNRVKITNGAATDADVTIDVVGENLVTGCTQNHVVVDIFGNLLAQSRLNGVRAVNVHTDEAKSFFLPEHKTNTLGGCSFELGGKEFWAYNVGTKAYTSEWKLYNITDKTFLSESTLYAKNTTETNKNQAANWLNVQVVDENTAYIYQYCPTVAVALWKVSRDIKYNVSATAENGTVEGAGKYKEGTTATLTATPDARYDFVNWTKGGVEVSTDATYSFEVTEDVELVANFSKKPDIAYELNGGQWNKYGWTSKKDMYDAFVADWKEYSNSVQYFCSYETQLGIGNSNQGLPTAILGTQDILGFMAQEKWAWLREFLDALATAQGKATMPTAATTQMRFALGNFFGEDNNNATSWVGAVDCSAGQADPEAFQPTWGHILSNPTQPTTTMELGNPYREGHDFVGWYETVDFTGAAVTTIDENTVGTFYAKWNLVIDENADNNSTVLAPYVGESVTVTVKRNFEPNKCYTLTLPFDMNASQIEDVFGNATVYEFYNLVEHNAEELYLEFIPTSSIQAGEPCLIVTPSGSFDANDGFMIEDVIISTTPQPVQVGAVTMMPVLDNGYLMDDPSEYYVWDGGLYCAGTYNMTSKGLRAYFVSSSPLPVRARVVLKDNEATSIPLVGVETGTQVRKIMKDGRLIIIRGEEQYTIQGQRMD